MKKTAKMLLLIGLIACLQTMPANAVIGPAALAASAGVSGIVSGASAVANGTWSVVKGVSGILWAVSKGLYAGGSALAHGIGTLYTPKQALPTPAAAAAGNHPLPAGVTPS